MEKWHIDRILAAFERCYNLQNLVKNDTRGSVDALAEQTGFRVSFITEHLEEIKAL